MAHLIDGTLSAGHARTLLGLIDRGHIGALAEKCVSQGLSVRELESLVKKCNRLTAETGDVTDKDRVEPVRVDYFSSLENRFTSASGRRV